MFSNYELMLALRYLRAKRREGFVSVITGFSFLGIMLGVATLIVVMAVMNGFRTEITKKILGMSGHISVSGYERQLDNFEPIIKTLKEIKTVTTASAVIDGQAMAISASATSGVMVKGIALSDIMERPLVRDNIKDGNLLHFNGNDKIIIGKELANTLNVGVGDEFTLISPEGVAAAIGTMPRMKHFTVIAIFESGMYEYDSLGVFMPLSAAQIFFKYRDAVSSVEVMIQNPEMASVKSTEIFNKLGQLYVVRDWQMQNASLFNALKVERSVMFLILSLIVFIAAFNIVSSLIMLVNDKERDIAILRTMGIKSRSILKIFFLTGSLIGVTGTLAGAALGVSFALNIDTIKQFLEHLLGTRLFDPVIYFLSELPADVKAYDCFKAIFIGLFFSLVATFYPALKAARKNPVEGLAL